MKLYNSFIVFTMNAPMSSPSIVKSAVRILVNRLFRVRTQGNFPAIEKGERVLVVSNHESFLDGLVLGLNLPFEATFVVHSQVAAHPIMGRLLKFIDYLPVDPSSPLAMKEIVRLVETGRPVVIFPEGRITTTGALMKIYDGAGFVAARTGARIFPVRLDGPARSYFSRLAGLVPRKLFPRITLHVAAPRQIAAAPARLTSAKARRRYAGEAMRDILLDMLVATQPRRTLFSAFLDARDTFGSEYRFIEDVRQIEESYGSLLRMATGIRHMVLGRTQPGEIVGVLMPTAAPTLAMILGLSAAGRVPAMLNYTAGREGVISACVAAGIRQLFVSRAFIEKGGLQGLLADLPDTLTVTYVEDLKASLTTPDRIRIACALPFARRFNQDVSPDDPAVVIFTSGSEGRPKGVVHSHASLLANIAQVRAVADFTPNDRFMIALPLFHSFGLTCGGLLSLVSGCKAFLYPTPLHYKVIPELVYDRNCSVLFGTSTFLGQYAKHAHPYDFGRLRYVIAGAEKLSESVRAAWIERFGIRVLEGYGASECAPVIAVNTTMVARSGSVGRLLPCIEHVLDPVPGLDAPAGQARGALRIKAPNVMKGYLRYERPGVIEAPEHEGEPGWYATGDIVRIDEDGFVHIEGRMKRFAKIAGEMVSLDRVEQLATQASPHGQHAVLARPDAARGEALVLFTTDSLLDRSRLVETVQRHGGSELWVARDIRFVSALPVLGTGKTNYLELKTLL